ncbi:hypothetical protein FB561_0960 [Kribbella amoyensis]|uniref:Uncharacterized protein n=1 Tax=Kribbella amoyensis TaxID=996641 RepID=A0A561BLY3_9ACTN|nr:hypothetical protein [Kribbella amoyensis]TWD79894.1 hypothetical protein FB561_0960 [Kribbella amoyensis]
MSTQKSGGQENGGYNKYDAEAIRKALDGVAEPGTKGSGAAQGEAPRTGAQRDIGAALDGRD